jgi:anthranilate phosphoribosyltransferase
VGIGFMFAPIFHPAMKNVGPVRKELGVRTVFNLLGPLTNPAHAPAQIIGVYDSNLTSVVAKVLRNLGVKRAMVVHGSEGLDEISIGHKTKISELKNGQITSYFLDPEALGLKLGNLTQILGSNAKNNAHILKHLLQGKEYSSRADILCLNAAAALMVGKKAGDWKSALTMAQEVLHSGKALKKLEELIKFSQKVK